MNVLLCALSDRTAAAVTRGMPEGAPRFFRRHDVTAAMSMMGAERATLVVLGGDSRQGVADGCRQLRASESCRDAVIVAVGGEQPDDVSVLMEAGADDVFVETFGEDILRSRLLVAQALALGLAARRRAEQDRETQFRSSASEAVATTAALRDLCESLATTLDSIGDGVIATDVAGAIVRMNPAAVQLTGWSFDEARGRSTADVLPIVDSETRVAIEDPIVHALREGAVVKLPSGTLLIRRDGTEIPIADSCASIRGGDGTVNGGVLVFRDLTTQCAAEANADRLQKQLVLADRMASVGTLAAGVAHEINNPLSYVSSNVDTALEEILSISGGSPSGRMKDLEAMLIEAREGVARVAKIVRGLKGFSRVEEERRRVVDLVAVIEVSVAMALNEIRPRARLVKDYGRVPLVEADDDRLGQVFINLLVNAAQAFRSGNDDTNEIRIVTSTDAKGRAVVEVRDTGPGISPGHLGRIFDPFFTTKPVGQGTGLGLAISHTIVASAGGELSVESALGRGTTFRVVLPGSTATTSSMPPPPGPPMDERLVPRSAILVVDDEPSLGSSIRRVLRHHDVTAVLAAQDALVLLGSGRVFDVVLSDLMMPGMSGMEFYAAIVRLYPKMARKVVFLTGGAFTPEANAFLESVDNERMDKPFNSEALRRMVQRVAAALDRDGEG
jgi:PAS domain S-box-containing protein